MRKFGSWWLALIILLAFAIIIWDMAQPRINPEEINQQLESALKKQDIIQGIQILENAIKKEPHYYRGRIQLAQIYLSQVPSLSDEKREYYLSRAEQHLNFYLQNDPKHDPRLLMLQIQIFEARRDFDSAYKAYQNVIKKLPDMVEARMGFLQLALASRNLTEVRENIHVIMQQPETFLEKFPHFYDLQAEYELLENNLQGASDSWDTFLKKFPQLFRTHRNWIELQQCLGKTEETQKKYQTLFSETTDIFQRFFYQQLYVQSLSPKEGLEYINSLRNSSSISESIMPHLLMQSISFKIQNGDVLGAIADCELLGKFPNQDSIRTTSWLSYCYLLQKEWEKCEKIAQELYQNPASKTTGLNARINLALAQKKGETAQQYVAEILQNYETEKLWSLDQQKEYLHYTILQARILYESKKWEEAISVLKKVEDSPKGWPYYWQMKMLEGQIYLSKGDYSNAIFCLEIAKNATRVPEIRLKSMIWKGIAEFLSGKDPKKTWQSAQSITWKNYLSDVRESQYLFAFLGQGDMPSISQELEKLPAVGNDHYFYLGLYHELKQQKEFAIQAYQKGMENSLGCEFPYFLLEQGQHRIK